MVHGVTDAEGRDGSPEEKERNTTMKKIATFAVLSLFAVILAQAEVTTKGGASALVSSPAPRSQAAPQAKMNCASCTSAYVTSTRLAFKGTSPVTTTTEKHGCSSCANTWVTSGHGKAK